LLSAIIIKFASPEMPYKPESASHSLIGLRGMGGQIYQIEWNFFDLETSLANRKIEVPADPAGNTMLPSKTPKEVADPEIEKKL
jgi:hypothetical protein